MKPKANHFPRAIAYGITLMLLLMAFVLSAVSCDCTTEFGIFFPFHFGIDNSYESSGFVYRSQEDGTCVVTSVGKCVDTDIMIPQYSPDSEKVVGIDDSAFEMCLSCRRIIIPEGVTSIGYGAFYGCRYLESVWLPEGLTSIGQDAFRSCKSLTSIKIPSSVTSIGEWAFSDCNSLQKIEVVPGNSVYHSAENCLIHTESKTLIAGSSASVIPDDGSVTIISWEAFCGRSHLQSINIPASVTMIARYAFADCSSLTSVTFSQNSKCSDIGDSAFSGCVALKSITIPSSVRNISYYAFENCNSLKSITFQGTKTQWNAISKGSDWNYGTGSYTIHCTDGDIAK